MATRLVQADLEHVLVAVCMAGIRHKLDAGEINLWLEVAIQNGHSDYFREHIPEELSSSALFELASELKIHHYAPLLSRLPVAAIERFLQELSPSSLAIVTEGLALRLLTCALPL